MQSDTSNNMFAPIPNSSAGTRLSNIENNNNRSIQNLQAQQTRTFYNPQSYQLTAVKAAAVQACQAATMNELFNNKNFQQLSLKTYMSGIRPMNKK